MADRESLMNAIIELECEPTTYSREILRKKWVEALTTAEFDPCVRLNGRTARKELSVYDAMMAEIHAEHDGEKAKVRNRRRADRKAKERNPRYIKRNGGKFDRNVWYEGSKVFHWEEDLRMPERRANSKAESEERDYAVELRNRDDALAYHSDYLDMAIDHAEKLEYWRNKKASVEYWELMIDEVSRQIIYEQNRVNELMRIADTIMEGECY